MWNRIASWRGRPAMHAVIAVADPPDGDTLELVGETLRASYGPEEDLDDRLVALMLELSLEQPAGKAPRRKRRRA